MLRFKNYNATGVAPDGRLFAGDLNLFQDLVAALSDFTQTHDVGVLRVGSSDLQLLKYGTAEFRMSGALRVDKIFRPLGGLIPGTFTEAGKAAIPANEAPYGLTILNSEKNWIEWNAGTDATRKWLRMGGARPVTIAEFLAIASPQDGEEAYVRITSGTSPLWHFRYSAAHSRWDAVGQQIPVYTISGGINLAQGVSMVNYADGGPILTIPLQGAYYLRGAAQRTMTVQEDSISGLLWIQAQYNGGGAANVEISRISQGNRGGMMPADKMDGELLAFGLPRNSNVVLRYSNDQVGAPVHQDFNRQLWISPVYVTQA